MRILLLLPLFLLSLLAYSQIDYNTSATVGAERFDQYLEIISDKNVGIVANQTSQVEGEHLVDILLDKGVTIKKVFAPEHGFRGTADAGEHIKSDTDEKTGLPIISLYGNNKKPTADQVNDLDVILFDIQDVGVRYYTYISTMHYVMEACAENDILFIVLDRPNPNGFYVDGPVLEKGFESFVGLHPVPVVHGMTVGEYAQMINGEGWLKAGISCELQVVKCTRYSHKDIYKLPVPPSPNLPNMAAVLLYPNLGFFEGTVVSVGRGTDRPFQIIGHPEYTARGFSFTPKPTHGAKNPKHNGIRCYGHDLEGYAETLIPGVRGLYLNWLTEMYNNSVNKEDFFNNFFDNLAGTDKLRKQVIARKSPDQIRSSWREDIRVYMQTRAKYLLYNDF